jgi:hypothetical protein
MPSAQSPTSKEPERGLALQKYLLLHSQHDALQKHLSQITPAVPAAVESNYLRNPSFSSSLSSSPSDDGYLYSPTSFHHQRSGSLPRPKRPKFKTRRSSLPATIDENLILEIAEDESKIKTVNQHIKSTLTDLLNCQSVRGDQKYRMWVQARLMDAEKELKGDRSRSREKRRMSQVISV